MGKRLNREGLKWSEYRWGHLILALPLAFVIHLYLIIVGKTSKQEMVTSTQLPEGAIVSLFHPEWPLFPASKWTWDQILTGYEKVSWLGIHHFFSYVGSLSVFLWRYRAVRFDWRSPEKPFQLVMSFLKENPKFWFAVRTDSGRPYCQVRGSLVAMSIQTGRSIVCVRQRSSRYFILNEHFIPLPFGNIITACSEPITAETMKALSPDVALNQLQTTMESLGRDLERMLSSPQKQKS